MSDEFDLRALIREVCAGSSITDPATLAKEVGRRIGRSQERAAIDQALPTMLQHYISRNRGSINVPDGHLAGDTQSGRAVGTPAPGIARSRKVAAIRETWRKMLGDRINIGPDLSDWKFLSDCTAVDLDYAAQLRENHARRNAARAVQLRSLAELLDQHQVTTVGELPTDALSVALGSAA